jgi:uncharacterized membrane protein HdeD (DUF308 family)
MRSPDQRINRLSRTLVGRGAIMLILGFVAAIWPEDVLVAALFAVGATGIVLGLYEIVVATSLSDSLERWRLMMYHGLAALTFGVLTVWAPVMSVRVTLGAAVAAISIWMIAYATLAFIAAIGARASTAPRRTLIACGCVHLGFAFVALTYPEATIFSLLYFGAIYAALFGAWQLVIGTWLERSGLQTLVSKPSLYAN